MTKLSRPAALRRLLSRNEAVIAPGVYDALTARLAERAGFPAVLVSGAAVSASLGLTNLTGHPAVAVRAGFVAGAPLMIMITGRLYDEATTLRVALAHEQATRWHQMVPEM